ncbi:mgtA regulatory leader peptide MgtL [Citrobacter amalonaticus]
MDPDPTPLPRRNRIFYR